MLILLLFLIVHLSGLENPTRFPHLKRRFPANGIEVLSNVDRQAGPSMGRTAANRYKPLSTTCQRRAARPCQRHGETRHFHPLEPGDDPGTMGHTSTDGLSSTDKGTTLDSPSDRLETSIRAISRRISGIRGLGLSPPWRSLPPTVRGINAQ